MAQININQIAEEDNEEFARWKIENIDVTFNKKTKEFTYELVEWHEERQDWISIKITKEEAKIYCEGELPDIFYS